MMLFEEFFKKKKINLVALQQDDEGLFSEFKDHYEQMGEKSFDHTKKYWFNKLRRRYPLPVESKVDKFKAENQIAEQTVTDTLTEPSTRDQAPDLDKSDLSEEKKPAAPAPKLGFKPKFKSASPVPPAAAEEAPVNNTAENKETPTTETPTTPVPKVGFKPRFKAGVTNSNKPVEEAPATANPEPETPSDTADNTAPAEPTATPPKIGFKPRFKAGVTNAPPAQETPQPTVEAPEEQEIKSDVPSENTDSTTASEPAPAKLGFKPRFKAGVTITKTTEETKAEAEHLESKETPVKEPAESNEPPSTETSAPKLGFKPRFKAGVTSTKPAEEVVKTQEQETVKEESIAPEEQQTEEEPAPKPAYKPRFTPNMIKRKPPEGE
jgi:hypothetical protein